MIGIIGPLRWLLLKGDAYSFPYKLETVEDLGQAVRVAIR